MLIGVKLYLAVSLQINIKVVLMQDRSTGFISIMGQKQMNACPLQLPSLNNYIIPFHPGLGILVRSDVFHNILNSSPASGTCI